MEIEIETDDGGLRKVETKRSRYQILSLDLLARCWRVKPPFGRIKKMKNPEYFRLIKDGSFVGFKRIVTEYLPAGFNRWQFDPIEHDSEDTRKLSRPAMGIVALKRERTTSG